MEVTYICNQGRNVGSIAERVIPKVLELCGIDAHYQKFSEEAPWWIKYPESNQEETWLGIMKPYLNIVKKLYDAGYDKQMKNALVNMKDLVLITIANRQDFFLLKEIINSGRKVVVGGPAIPLYTTKTIRQYLINLGADKKNTEDNLIVVYGLVDLTTDLKQIINKWEDTHIKTNCLETIYNVTEFVNTDHIRRPRVVFNLRCIHGKCTFCSRSRLYQHDLLKNASPQAVIDSMRGLTKHMKEKKVFLEDDYFIFNDKNTYILEQLSDIYVSIKTGLPVLLSEKNIKRINKCINRLMIGIETPNDYGLEHFRKGFTYRMLQEALEQMIKYMDRDKTIIFFVIVDSPQRNLEGIRRNYEKLADIKKKLLDAGFNNFKYHPFPLVYKSPPGLMSDRYKINRNVPDQYLTGMSYILKDKRPINDKFSAELNDEGMSFIPYNEAIVRLDENDQYLESDISIIGHDSLTELFKR